MLMRHPNGCSVWATPKATGSALDMNTSQVISGMILAAVSLVVLVTVGFEAPVFVCIGVAFAIWGSAMAKTTA